MKFYLLSMVHDAKISLDKMKSCIVQAYNEEQAREVVFEHKWPDGNEIWFDAEKVECRELKIDFEAGPCVILASLYQS